MKILHLTKSYIQKDVLPEDIYTVSSNTSLVFLFSKYNIFRNFLKNHEYDVLHVHSVASETFGWYAWVARLCGMKVVLSMHNPSVFTYAYVVKRLAARMSISHIICTSRYDMNFVDTYHLARKSKRSLVYEAIDVLDIKDILGKESARSYIYKKLGVSFTKNIRIVGAVINNEHNDGIEHMIDMAYLADLYKNLTNTIFIILSKQKLHQNIHDQIHDSGVDGICFIIEDIENPEQYIKAFDIYLSPRIEAGDLYTVIRSIYAGISRIVTKVGDMKEVEAYVSAPLVPINSAKYLTEALMYVIARDKEVSSRVGVKPSVLPKKFLKDTERHMIGEIYTKVLRKA